MAIGKMRLQLAVRVQGRVMVSPLLPRASNLPRYEGCEEAALSTLVPYQLSALRARRATGLSCLSAFTLVLVVCLTWSWRLREVPRSMQY